jgi:hypothetical protein
MFVLKNLASVEEYAKMCGVATTTINYRHKHHKIVSVMIDGYIFIDYKASPPAKFVSRHSNKPLHSYTLPYNLYAKDMVCISSYAERKGIRSDIFYGMAMMDLIPSVVISKRAFILKKDADSISAKRPKDRY